MDFRFKRPLVRFFSCNDSKLSVLEMKVILSRLMPSWTTQYHIPEDCRICFVISTKSHINYTYKNLTEK